MGTKNYDNALDLITFSRASGGTYLDSDGLLKTASTNIPRIEYDADGTVKGLLIEEQRTNLLTYSNEFDNATNVNLDLDKSYTSPDGTSNATRATADANGRTAVYYNITTGDTLSCFMKAGSIGTYGWIEGIVSGDEAYAVFDLEEKTVVASAFCDPLIEDYGNGWLRCIVANKTKALSFFAVGIADTYTSGNPWDNSTTSIGSHAYIYGAQLEAGSFPTSHIPTSGATATRSADIASIPVTDFGYNQKAGTVVVEGQPIAAGIHANSGFDLYGNASNKISFRRAVFLGSDGGVTQWSSALGFDNAGDGSAFKYAGSFKPNSVVACVDGSLSSEDTSATVPSTITKLDMSRVDANSSLTLNCHIKSIQYFPRRLTNNQLQELTS